jgi:hypothetical protein
MDFSEETFEEKKVCLGKIIDTAIKVIPAVAPFVPALQPVAAIIGALNVPMFNMLEYGVVKKGNHRVNISGSLLWSNHMRIKLLVWAQISAIVLTASLMTW